MNDFDEDLTYGPDILENLIEDYENEAISETSWPTMVLHFQVRKQVWSMCESVGQSAWGVPATACRLAERFLSISCKICLKDRRDYAGWAQHKKVLGRQIYLIIAVSIQLAAKVSDRVAYVPASFIRSVLMKAGIQHTKEEILAMEIHFYKTLDYRLPKWSTLETAEFLARMLGLAKERKVTLLLAPITDMTELHRDIFEDHIKAWDGACNTPGSSSSKAATGTVHNLALCAGVLSATMRHEPPPSEPGLTARIAGLVKIDVAYVTAIADIILEHILPDKKPKPLLKRKRNQ